MNIIRIPTKKSLKKLEKNCDKIGKDWIYPIINNKKNKSVLGSGKYGRVYTVCKHKSDSKTNKPDCKYILKKQNVGPEFINEVKILRYLNNINFKYVPKIYDVWECNNQGYIVMEKLNVLFKCDITDETSIRIKKIIEKLHKVGVVHRDLHEDNIACNDKNEYRLIDFGISKYFSINNEEFESEKEDELYDLGYTLNELKENITIGLASKYGNFNKVKSLLKDPRVDPSAENNSAIILASENGHLDVVRLLLSDHRVDPSSDSNLAIQMASKNGHAGIVRLLLSNKSVDPSDNNNYAIKWSSRNGHLDVVRLLLNNKSVDPSYNNNYAIRWSSRNNHLDVVKLLLNDKSVDPSVDNNRVIRYAIKNNHLDMVKLLLKDERVDYLYNN